MSPKAEAAELVKPKMRMQPCVRPGQRVQLQAGSAMWTFWPPSHSPAGIDHP